MHQVSCPVGRKGVGQTVKVVWCQAVVGVYTLMPSVRVCQSKEITPLFRKAKTVPEAAGAGAGR